MTSRPPPKGADRQEHEERDREQQDGERGGALRVSAVVALEDVERRDLGLEGQVARDEDDGAELTDRAGERKRPARQERGKEVREDDAAKDRQPAGTEGGRRLLHLTIELDQHGLHGAD